jgi:hypothetical protein
MSKLILPSPVILASESFDVNASGEAPVGATATGNAVMSPLRFLIPAYATTKDSSIDIDLMCTSTLDPAVTFSLAPQLVFTNPDGVGDANNYIFATMPVNVTVAAQITHFSIKIFFARGITGAANAYRPVTFYRGVSCDTNGGGRTSLDTGSWGVTESPAMTRMDYPRAVTVQLIRTATAGAGTSRTNIRAVRAVGYNLNMDNWTV